MARRASRQTASRCILCSPLGSYRRHPYRVRQLWLPPSARDASCSSCFASQPLVRQWVSCSFCWQPRLHTTGRTGSRRRVRLSYDKIVELSRAWSGAGYVQLVLQQGDRLSIVRAAIDRGKRAYPEAEWTGVIGRSARERRTIWLPDVNQDSAYIRAEPTTRSEPAVPLVRSDGSGLLGVINCEWDRPVDLPPNETNWFDQLTLQIVTALKANPAQLRAPPTSRLLA